MKNREHIRTVGRMWVDEVFTLMLETLWVAPFDRRRGNPLLCDFERCARDAVRVLHGLNPDRAAEQSLRSVERLRESVRRIADAGMFPRERTDAALAAAERIVAGVERVCGPAAACEGVAAAREGATAVCEGAAGVRAEECEPV